MSDDTYYTVLDVPETASLTEVKAAYRTLIKQVHPDTLSSLSPYLKRIAEDKAKEITEAYAVLSNCTKRREYDRQLAEYRRQSIPPPAAPQPPPRQAASQGSPGPYCNNCGASLYGSGFCPKCNKFATPAPSPPQPRVVRRFGYNWAPLMRWAREHPILTVSMPVFFVWLIAAAVSSNDTSSQADTKCPASQKVEVDGRFVCKPFARDPPGLASQAAAPVVVPSTSAPAKQTSGKYSISDLEEPAPGGKYSISDLDGPAPSVIAPVSGTYLGTVHNQTVGVTSSFVVVFYQKKTSALYGCMEVKPPLYGSGALHGSIRGSHVDFVVGDIRLQGDASRNAITGSYVVSRRDGEQLGDFRLTKASGTETSYRCADGKLIKFEVVDTPVSAPQSIPAEKRHSKLTAIYAIVSVGYHSTMYKRCAFLPLDNYGRCNYGPETVAHLKSGDRIRVLSPLVRAENGDDIYKVRTQQGWEGWIDARGITLESQ
jgi:hypothetical protein